MLLLIPLLPFVGFLINAFFGKRLSKAVSGGIACAAIIASFFLGDGLAEQLYYISLTGMGMLTTVGVVPALVCSAVALQALGAPGAG